jgi:hypothetical protein
MSETIVKLRKEIENIKNVPVTGPQIRFTPSPTNKQPHQQQQQQQQQQQNTSSLPPINKNSSNNNAQDILLTASIMFTRLDVEQNKKRLRNFSATRSHLSERHVEVSEQ